MIERTLSTGEKIYVFDDIFKAVENAEFEKYASNCFFRRIPIEGVNKNSRSNGESFFGAILSQADLNEISIFEADGFKRISSFWNNMSIERSWILCAEPSTKYLYHTDSGVGSITLLYYVNTFWHPEWGGETLFCNSAGEPEIAIACKPNRAVIFPSDVLHKPSCVSKDAILRYSWTTTFKK